MSELMSQWTKVSWLAQWLAQEMIGALLAGWDEVVGVELSPEYAEIARARLKHWQRYRRADSDAADKERAGQTNLLDLVGP